MYLRIIARRAIFKVYESPGENVFFLNKLAFYFNDDVSCLSKLNKKKSETQDQDTRL